MAKTPPSIVSQGTVGLVGPAKGPSTEAAYAASLLAKVVVPPGARRASAPPLRRLDRPFEQMSLDRPPTVASRFWTIDESMAAAYAWMSHHAPPGTSMGNAQGQWPNGIEFRSIDREQDGGLLPANMTYGDLQISVASLPDGSAAIAAYASVRAQPVRPADSMPRADGSTVVLGWWQSQHGPHRSRILTGPDAATFVRAYDGMKVSTIGVHSCPAGAGHDDVSVTITSAGHRWYSDLTTCWPIAIARDGHRLVSVNETDAFRSQIERWSGRQPGDNANPR